MKALNVGCGARFHPAWTNIDVVSQSPQVQVYNCRAGIPFPDNTFDVVYHSHILEHFPKPEVLGFVRECLRVVRPGGILRAAVPDLERLARLYLNAVEKASGGDTRWEPNYDWLMLELYDQTVRTSPGGGMIEYLTRNPLHNEAFLLERFGGEMRRLLQAIKDSSRLESRPAPARTAFVGSVARRLAAFPRAFLLRCLLKLLGQDAREALQIGQFRLSGEIHHWMYDRYSLARLLTQGGFVNLRQCGPAESVIPGWASFHLDTEPDGSTYKPDSMYMEAEKPK